MNIGIFYLSRTGNTKRFAQAITELTNASLNDVLSTDASVVEKFDLVFLGTPVEGASPTKEALAFIDNMPRAEGKKAVLFCTYRLFGNERSMKVMAKQLEAKGYQVVLKVSKKGMKPEQSVDFSKELSEVKKAIDNLAVH
jgi:flavodoxin